MPIDITNMDELDRLIANIPDKLSPKTFDKDLTGSNKRLSGLFNRDFHTYSQISNEHHGMFTSFGGQSTTTWEPEIAINSILNFRPELIKTYERKGAIRNNAAITSLPLPGTLTNDRKEYIRPEYELEKPLSVFGMNDMKKDFTKIKELNNGEITLYSRFIVNTVHTFTYKDKSQEKPIRPYKFEVNITPVMVYTKDQQNDLSDDKIYMLTSPDKSQITANLSLLNSNEAVVVVDPLFIPCDGDQYVSLPFDNDNLFDNMYTNLWNMIVEANDEDMEKVGSHSIYKDLNHQCEILPQSLIDDVQTLLKVADKLATNGSKTIKQHMQQTYAQLLITSFAQIANYLQSYLTSDDYAKLADLIKNTQSLPVDELLTLDLRLLLADRLQQLNQLKSNHQLYQFRPTNNTVDQQWIKNPNYSNQQKSIIRTKSPLVVGTAGAGSGKTHTVTGRLDYLKQQGEDLSHVLCLSFTNTAVTNIKNRYPKIQSKTLASMFDDIYTATFPKQRLSNETTLANVIDNLNIKTNKFFKSKPLSIDRLKAAQYNLVQSLRAFSSSTYRKIDERSATISLLNTITSYLDESICILDAVQQTTLQLEPVIVYAYLLRKRQLTIPDNYQQLNFIIADESQDISTFEYILLLDITKMYHSNLMIIGDGSQTLYEFRNANPMFMNTLEASDAFKTYHLTTNYRSNKSILMYANEFLNIIDANKYAKIQLQPNSFSKVTSTDFKNTIKITDFELDGRSNNELIDSLTENIKKDTQLAKWICDKYQKHEKIALIAYRRKEADALKDYAQEVIQKNFNKLPQTLSLNPKPTYADSSLTTALNNEANTLSKLKINSSFISEYEKIINQSIIDTQTLRHISKPFVPDYVVELFARLKNSVYMANLIKLVIGGAKPISLLHAKMKRELIDAEVRYNNIRQSQLNNKHREFINEHLNDAEIITSTIHSVKGLEFDNTIVYCREPSTLSQEDARMYMVALTRAKSHEYILNGYRPTSANDHANIETDQLAMFHTPMPTAYQRILKRLP